MKSTEDPPGDVPVSEARAQLSSLVRVARGAPVYLSNRGRRVAAIIDAEELQRLLSAAEDLEDIQAAQAARDEMAATQQAAIPWEQVRADLGLS